MASIGPYGAHLHDGSEYTGSYADFISKEDIQKWHRVRLDAVIDAGVDALAIETIPCLVSGKLIKISLDCYDFGSCSVFVDERMMGPDFLCLAFIC